LRRRPTRSRLFSTRATRPKPTRSPRSTRTNWAAPYSLLAAPADEIKALLDQGNSAEAYALAKKYPNELGSPGFDLYFGIAAIDTGHAGEGVLALERYIANFPGNQSARLELARGYFVLGDDARAREEFDAVLKTDPPAGVQANIQRFMDAIRARESRYQTTTGFYVEAGIGVDSNVNAGVGSPNITLPVFGPVTLLSGVKTGDTFTHLAAGGNVTHPVAPGVALFGSANAELKFNHNDSVFDLASAGIAGGVSYLQDRNLWRATVSHGGLWVENDRFRSVTAIAGEVHHQLDELQMVNGAIQYADLDHPGANSVRDAQFYNLGVGYRRAFVGSFQPLLSVSLNYGEEDNRRGRPDLGRNLFGGRIGLAVTPAPKWALTVGGTYQESKYDGADPLLGVVRKDTYYGLDLTASYAITRNWSVRGEYQYIQNDSNVALFEYDRNLFAVKLRYEFK